MKASPCRRRDTAGRRAGVRAACKNQPRQPASESCQVVWMDILIVFVGVEAAASTMAEDDHLSAAAKGGMENAKAVGCWPFLIGFGDAVAGARQADQGRGLRDKGRRIRMHCAADSRRQIIQYQFGTAQADARYLRRRRGHLEAKWDQLLPAGSGYRSCEMD